jgi:hypothetical protein
MPMRQLPEFLREIHLIGRRCREHMLDSEHFPVLRNAPFIWVGHSVLRTEVDPADCTKGSRELVMVG